MSRQVAATPQQANDALAFALFIPILAISLPTIANASVILAMLMIAVPVVWYVFINILSPLLGSCPLIRPELNEMIEDDRIEFRTTKFGVTRAIDVGWRRFIIFNESDLTGHYKDWRALLGHEYAHIKNRDARFFHYVGIFGLVALCCIVYFIAVFSTVFLISSANETSNQELLAAMFVPGLLVAVSIFFFFWIRQSLHAREFIADRNGYHFDNEAFNDWMRRMLRFENRKGILERLNIYSLLRWFTHPSFARRFNAITDQDISDNFKLHAEVLRSIGFLYGGGLLSYFVFEALNTYFSPDTEISNLSLALIVLMLFLPVAAACGATSVAAMTSAESGGWKGLAVFCGTVSIANWFTICIFYFLVVSFGQYGALTSDLPDVPEENMSSGIIDFLVIALNYGISIFLMTLLARRFVSRFRYNVPLHVVIGGLALPAAFLIAKLQWSAVG